MSELEERYGFASQVAKLTDDQLVARFNHEVGNTGTGRARFYFLSCLSDELRSRSFDSSVICHDNGMRLNRRVRLDGDVLVLDE